MSSSFNYLPPTTLPEKVHTFKVKFFGNCTALANKETWNNFKKIFRNKIVSILEMPSSSMRYPIQLNCKSFAITFSIEAKRSSLELKDSLSALFYEQDFKISIGSYVFKIKAGSLLLSTTATPDVSPTKRTSQGKPNYKLLYIAVGSVSSLILIVIIMVICGTKKSGRVGVERQKRKWKDSFRSALSYRGNYELESLQNLTMYPQSPHVMYGEVPITNYVQMRETSFDEPKENRWTSEDPHSTIKINTDTLFSPQSSRGAISFVNLVHDDLQAKSNDGETHDMTQSNVYENCGTFINKEKL